MRQGGAAEFPDGIGEDHVRPPGWQSVLVSWAPLGVLGVLILVALSGILGGGRNPTMQAVGSQASLFFNAPVVLRSGQFFEMRLRVVAHRRIDKPVIAVPVGYWRDLTINSFYPAPIGEQARDGHFEFEFDPLEAGEAMNLKIDGQVNPPLVGRLAGRLELRDAERTIVAMPVSLRVLP
jgi:hypothetical protein